MTEGIAWDRFATCFHFGYDTFNSSAFTDENVHVVVGIHQSAQTGSFASKVQFHLWNIYAMNREIGAGETEAGEE